MTEQVQSPEPHWERGHRCHGYWHGTTRLGSVSLPPRGFAVADHGYGWETDKDMVGTAPTLAKAKRAVEDRLSKPESTQHRCRWCDRVCFSEVLWSDTGFNWYGSLPGGIQMEVIPGTLGFRTFFACSDCCERRKAHLGQSAVLAGR